MWAIIPARGGSKGIPRKNARAFRGKPLIVHTIEQAQQSTHIERVIVSTDDDEIARIARTAGAEVPFMRPKKLAEDNSSEWLVWRHALEAIKRTDGKYPEILVNVPVTAPLRSVVDLKKCITEYKKSNVDIIITLTDCHRSPYFNMVKINKEGMANLVIKPNETIIRRQDAPIVYDMTTVAYVTNPKFVMEKNGIFEGKVGHVYVPIERALDIDTPFDFRIAELLLNDK